MLYLFTFTYLWHGVTYRYKTSKRLHHCRRNS